MKHDMKTGWGTAVKHLPLIVLLFLYQLLWGFFLYRFVDSIVVPLLRRFPDTMDAGQNVQLFFVEAQFQLLKTGLIQPYLWMFGGLVILRMLVSPFINAGLFYSLHHAKEEGGTLFMEGIRRAWKPVMLLYWLESALVLSPLLWLLPRWFHWFMSGENVRSWAAELLPYAAGWLIWSIAVHLLFLGLQFGIIAGKGAGESIGIACRRFLPLAAITVLMWMVGAGIGLLSTAASMFWAGLLALILYQGFHLVRTFMKVWTIASQYAAWTAKNNG
jgi:hypothetical protein